MLAEKKKGTTSEDHLIKLPYGAISGFEDLQKHICKTMGVHWKPCCKIYDSSGNGIFEEDLNMLSNDQVIYIAPDGKLM